MHDVIPRETASTDGAPPSTKRSRKAGSVNVEVISGKVEAGRYRSPGAFESDVRQMLTQGKGVRSLSPEQVWVWCTTFRGIVLASRLDVHSKYRRVHAEICVTGVSSKPSIFVCFIPEEA